MKRSDILVRVIYGQGGKSPWSDGMITFADRLRKMGYAVLDDVEWHQPGLIAALLDADPHPRKVVIGYSLGANCLTWLSNKLQRPIDLGVAYDPSWGVPIVMPAPIEPVNRKVKRCIHYHGWPSPVGGARLTGPTVEVVGTWTPHPLVDNNEGLHQRTLAALAQLEK